MSRLVFAGIVIFWLTMTTLLVRMQIQPGSSALREVPPARVLALLFEHAQASSLNFQHDGMRYGSISLYPSIGPDGTRMLKFGGHTLLRAGYLPHDRLAIDGVLRLSEDLQLARAEGSFGLQGEKVRLAYRYDAQRKTLAYTLEREGAEYRRDTIALEQSAMERLAPELGIEPAMLESALVSGKSLAVSAHYATFGYRDEKVAAFCLTLKRENTTLTEVYVSQLGQILQVTTPFGLKMVPDVLLP